MKKFLKNAVIIMLVICFILNIVNLIGQIIERYTVIPEIAQLAEKVRDEGIEIKAEEGYQMLAAVYSAGNGGKHLIQIGILGISAILGIVLGMIKTFEEKSKIKLLLIYILGMLITALIPTVYDIIYYMSFENLLSNFLDYLEFTWIWYTLIFFVLYAIRIYISRKNAGKLNETLKQKMNRE